MKNLDTLTILTKALWDNGMDYEVTLNGSNVRVRLFSKIDEVTIGMDTSDSLEGALSSLLANAVKVRPFEGLSRL